MKPETGICPRCGTQAGLSLRSYLTFVGIFLISPILGLFLAASTEDFLGDFGSFLVILLAMGIGLLVSVGLLVRAVRSGGRDWLTAAASVGAVVCYAILLGWFVIPAFLKSDGGERRVSCVNNLKQIGLILNLYEYENRGHYPPIDDTRNNFIFEGDVIYPEYMTDAGIMACPRDPSYDPKTNFRLRSNDHHPDCSAGDSHPDCITDMSYCYLGWVVTTDEQAEAFFDAYDTLTPEDYGKDIVVPAGKGNGGGSVIHRLEEDAVRFLNDHMENAERFFSAYEKLQAEYGKMSAARAYEEFDELCRDPAMAPYTIPVAWDKPTLKGTHLNHFQEGTNVPYGNVLYLDGHVEKVFFGQKFPMTETMAHLLDERPRAPIPDCEE